MSRPRHRRRGRTAMQSIRPEYTTEVSDCFVACSARALSLIVPPSPRSVGTTHATIGLFRRLNWATSPRSGWRYAPLRAGPASGTLAGRPEVCVPPVTESHIDAATANGRGVRMPGMRCLSSAGSGGTTPQAAGHHEQMALVVHAPNTYTQAKGTSPQDPERRRHATRQYTVKVSLLTSEAPHPVHTAPAARMRTCRV